MVYGESKSCDHAVTSRGPERSNSYVSRDHNTIRAQYIRKQLEMLFSNNRNYQIVCSGNTVGYPSDTLASSSCSVYDVIYSIIFRMR